MWLKVRPINDLMSTQAMNRALRDIEEDRIRSLVSRSWSRSRSRSRSASNSDSDNGMEEGMPVHVMTDPESSMSDRSTPETMDHIHRSPTYSGRNFHKTHCPPWGVSYQGAPPESESDPDSGNEVDMYSEDSLPYPVPAAPEIITLGSSPFSFDFSPEYRPTYQCPSPSYSPTSPRRAGSPDSDGLCYKQVSVSTPLQLINCYDSE